MSRVWGKVKGGGGRLKGGARKAMRYRAVQVGAALVVAAGVFAAGYFVGDASNNTTISNLQGEVADLETEVDDLESENTTLKADLATTKVERDDARDELARVTGAEESIETEVGEGVRVVGRGKTLKLEEMDVTLNDYEVQGTITSSLETIRASGTFVTITLTIKNKLNSPQTPPDDEAFALLVDGNEYSADFNAMNTPGDSFVWESDDLQPGNEQTGTVTFDVPEDVASDLGDGILLVSQFSGTDLPVAGLRLE